ncbi:MAG: hypothetical protein KF850_10820 [Labilithrix sp.]|nr:hypothetical protein [Labilithrix sp.]
MVNEREATAEQAPFDLLVIAPPNAKETTAVDSLLVEKGVRERGRSTQRA